MHCVAFSYPPSAAKNAPGIPGHSLLSAQVFKRRFVVEEFPDDLWRKAPRLFFGADFGFAQAPYTLVRCFIHDRRLYMEYEAYGTGIDLDEMPAFYRTVPGVGKWPIKADAAAADSIVTLEGWSPRCSRASSCEVHFR